mmetsp:Transcript_521/g.1250  ORF Transcript_521/g.1250 Transcript_521/m.1250 type:complete len:101 (+) Transcript_521:1301-1603(+)
MNQQELINKVRIDHQKELNRIQPIIGKEHGIYLYQKLFGFIYCSGRSVLCEERTNNDNKNRRQRVRPIPLVVERDTAITESNQIESNQIRSNRLEWDRIQ